MDVDVEGDALAEVEKDGDFSEWDGGSPAPRKRTPRPSQSQDPAGIVTKKYGRRRAF